MSSPISGTRASNVSVVEALHANPYVVWDEAKELWICTACQYSVTHAFKGDMRKHLLRKKHFDSIKMIKERNERVCDAESSALDSEGGAVLQIHREIYSSKTQREGDNQKDTVGAKSKNEDIVQWYKNEEGNEDSQGCYGF